MKTLITIILLTFTYLSYGQHWTVPRMVYDTFPSEYPSYKFMEEGDTLFYPGSLDPFEIDTISFNYEYSDTIYVSSGNQIERIESDDYIIFIYKKP